MAIVTSLVSVAGISAGDVPRRGSVVVEEDERCIALVLLSTIYHKSV